MCEILIVWHTVCVSLFIIFFPLLHHHITILFQRILEKAGILEGGGHVRTDWASNWALKTSCGTLGQVGGQQKSRRGCCHSVYFVTDTCVSVFFGYTGPSSLCAGFLQLRHMGHSLLHRFLISVASPAAATGSRWARRLSHCSPQALERASFSRFCAQA